MPTIAKIRFTNVVYEGGNKRYTDEIFHFQGENSAIVLENGGGKTVFIQTVLQAILPHTSLANRKIKDTLTFDDGPAHIAIEWIKNDRPRIYALTVITIFPQQNAIDSYRYVYEYGPNDPNSIENLPFTHETANGQKRIASHAEMKEYYSTMSQKAMAAQTFSTISGYTEYIEKNFQIISDEWKSINTINAAEGDVEKFFEACPTEKALYEKLLIPTVEQSIAAFEKHQFVNIFEKHRDKFQLFKQLNAQLKEYELIENRLENYVNDVAAQHELMQQYEAQKRLGKKYATVLQQLIQGDEQKLVQVQDQQKQLQSALTELQHKQKSYDIALIEEKLKSIMVQYEGLLKKKTAIQAEVEEKQLYFANMKYAKEKQLLHQYEQQLASYKETLQQIENQFSITDLLVQLDAIKEQIRGNYLNEEDNYKKQHQAIQLEENQYERKINEQQQSVEELAKNSRAIDMKIANYQSKIDLLSEQNEAAARSLFDNELQKQLPLMELRTQWSGEAQRIDEQIIEQQNKRTQRTLQKQQQEQQKNELSTKLLTLKEEEIKTKESQHMIGKREQQLRLALMQHLPRVTEATDLYIKETSIVQQLGQLLEKQERLYSESLHKERLAFRYVDDYGEQQSFFADPYIAKKLPAWSQQFQYLETAIDYAQNDEQLQVDTALLAITLITTDEEKEKLEQKIIDSANNISYPIQVWSLSQVIAISKGELIPPLHLVEPGLWQQLSDLEAFQDWQQQAQRQAEERKQQRQQIDETRVRLSQINEQLLQFYVQYPFEQFQKLQDKQKNIGQKTYEAQKQLAEAAQFIVMAEDELSQIRETMDSNKERHKYYTDKVQKLLAYEKQQQEIQQLQLQQKLEEKNKQGIDREQQQLQQQYDDTKAQFKEIQERKTQMEREYDVLVAGRHLYKKVQDIVPTFTDIHYEVLAQQYTTIEVQIQGIAQDRQSTEQLIEQQMERIYQSNQQLEQLLDEYSDIDVQLPLPIDFEQLIKQLPNVIKSLKTELEKYTKLYEVVNDKKIGEEHILRMKLADIDEPVKFTEPLTTVKYQLEQEEKNLKLRQDTLFGSMTHVKEHLEKLQQADQKVQILNGKHSFLAPDIAIATLTAEEETDFSYRQQQFIEGLQTKLDELRGNGERHATVVFNSKDAFIKFCQLQVSEVRLRNTIIDGVQLKTSYGELVKHQQSMGQTIHISRQYTQENIKNHDKDLVQFVEHIHVHLRKVEEELKQIPRKTKVHVDGEDILIYRFTIPEWSDEEGLAQIRARIDWIMDQLEQIEQRTMDEQESKQKARKQLEEWLSTVQLLRYITQNKEWRIACRKVMNSNRIAKSYETWSRSNAWSGGEKWSKNMALFLGVLNYVAEKRQFISSKKKSRTVILDNPFGKASSDHVLSPVFFIAEQLGFQIIALTAHVEGKFLHDYFPIVYSCRLRSAVGTEKLLMETKKTIHHALFQDHDEGAKEIQLEQLQLFEEE